MQSSAARNPVSVANAAAVACATAQPGSSLSSNAPAASHTAARAASRATSMLAQRCFTAWNCPMGRPNCTRTWA